MDFRASFQGCAKVFLAVVHVEDEAQALRNVSIARNYGAHGVFLINHSINYHELYRIYRCVRRAHPTYWIGLNPLDLDPAAALAITPDDVSGLWFDHGGVDVNSDDPACVARELQNLRDASSWRGVYFGGVAFKYQPQGGDPATEARLAAPHMDVVTTSGNATKSPPSIAKIASMRAAIGQKPLAIASGMTPENVGVFLDYADCVLVATGVSFSHTEFNPERLRALADIVRAC